MRNTCGGNCTHCARKMGNTERIWSAKAHAIYSVASHLNLLSLLAYLFEYIIEWPKPQPKTIYIRFCFFLLVFFFSFYYMRTRARALIPRVSLSLSLVLVALKLVRCLWSSFLLFHSCVVYFLCAYFVFCLSIFF